MRSQKGRDRYAGTVYYKPKDWGLVKMAEIDYSTGSYEFDLRVIWKDEDGVLWSGADSGCSCPSPFEGFFEESDFERVTPEWVNEVLIPELRENSKKDWHAISRGDADGFLSEVRELLPKGQRERVPQSVM